MEEGSLCVVLDHTLAHVRPVAVEEMGLPSSERSSVGTPSSDHGFMCESMQKTYQPSYISP